MAPDCQRHQIVRKLSFIITLIHKGIIVIPYENTRVYLTDKTHFDLDFDSISR